MGKDSEDNKVLETRLVLATREVSGSREDSASLETRAETPGCKMTDPAASGEDTRSSATHIGIQICTSHFCNTKTSSITTTVEASVKASCPIIPVRTTRN